MDQLVPEAVDATFVLAWDLAERRGLGKYRALVCFWQVVPAGCTVVRARSARPVMKGAREEL